MNRIDFIYRRKYDLLLLVILISGVSTYLIRNFVLEKNHIQCTEGDVYVVSEWGECSISGVKTRKVSRRPDEEITCINAEKVIEPKDVTSCEYIPFCTDKDFEVGIWSACVNGVRKREIKNLTSCVISAEDNEMRKFSSEEICAETTKSTLLLKNYITQIEPGSENPYQPNYRNLRIIPQGKFKSVSLIISAETTIKDGSHYSVPDEHYYLMFALNDSIARAIGTSRLSGSRFDISDDGIIQGVEMPKTVKFDLSNTRIAKANNEGIGFFEKNYLSEIFNPKSGQEITMTLFLGDGRSMTTADLDKRIFGEITEAYFEYECLDSNPCSIQRIPELNI